MMCIDHLDEGTPHPRAPAAPRGHEHHEVWLVRAWRPLICRCGSPIRSLVKTKGNCRCGGGERDQKACPSQDRHWPLRHSSSRPNLSNQPPEPRFSSTTNVTVMRCRTAEKRYRLDLSCEEFSKTLVWPGRTRVQGARTSGAKLWFRNLTVTEDGLTSY